MLEYAEFVLAAINIAANTHLELNYLCYKSLTSLKSVFLNIIYS